MKKYLNNIKEIFFLIFFVEILSFTAFYFPTLNNPLFIVLLLLFFIVSFYKLEYGLYIVLGELFVGSMGSLFVINLNGLVLSIRIAMWIILMSLWFTKVLIEFFKKKNNLKFLESKYSKIFIVLFLFIAWGAVNGLLQGNSYNNIFFDLNGWFYFSLIFPIYDCFLEKKDNLKETKLFFVLQVLAAAVFWMCFKTLILLFIFSHKLYGIMSVSYEWVRDTRVGEITKMPDGVMRIFFQSHIFVVIFFFFVLFLLNQFLFRNNYSIKKIKQNRLFLKFLSYVAVLIILMSVVIIGFSRSIWVGFILALFVFLIYIFYLYGFKKVFLNLFILFSVLFFSYFFILLIIKIPLNQKSGNFAVKTVQNRVSDVGESAISSRWSLLPLLWHQTKRNIFIGNGYGSEITYKSSDPRILQKTTDGLYTTYAFEWGWVDIWHKLGFFGFFIYLFLIISVFLDVLLNKNLLNDYLVVCFVLSLLFVVVVNFFTPYLNHPLGIGYLMLVVVLIDSRYYK